MVGSLLVVGVHSFAVGFNVVFEGGGHSDCEAGLLLSHCVFEEIPETQFHEVVRCTSLAASICLYYHSSQISVRVYVVCSYLKLKDLSEVVHGMWCLVKRIRVSEVHDLLNSVTWIYKIVF